ncbi:hypothetical protein DXA97_13935 [Clostridium sp. OF09-36]|uniref:hypothetical protein n=1 Tax=Clostridium sp. OF09-36 TaxID=2292310 RepID=UPI000E485FE9|nr:hypothetical protein [Clostridium sp. OF09-36]RHV86286.1 hypothetical protein DXA97_13935 [Clostridium sp. OF09-36]
MAVTKRYKVYRCDKLIGDYTAVDAADMLKCTPGTVRSYASGGNKLYGEYTFEVVEPEPVCKAGKSWTMTRDQAVDWEDTRQRLLSSGADLSRYVLKPEPSWR